jgi:dipeptidyl aminopeptidase/acylaminoacyl peptidase
VRLRDFGRQDSALAGDPPFSVSPDGRLAALVLRRGDPVRDDFCIGVAVVPLDGSGPARLVDVGGEFILNVGDARGIPDIPIGNAEPVTPRWSPDGRWLAYLRRDGARTRAWRARADGSGAEAVSRLADDARDVRWSVDGQSLMVRTRRPVTGSEAALAAEERSGFLYDRRFWTLSQSRPRPPLEEVEQRIDPADGRMFGDGDPSEERAPARPPGARLLAKSPSGTLAWTSPDDSSVMMGPETLKIELNGRRIPCRLRSCADSIAALWWAGEELVFLQGGGPDNGGVTSLMRWRPGRGFNPRLILSTRDVLMGCQTVRRSIVCARETATRPRHLVRIDLGRGTVTMLYDPNPEFSSLQVGQVQRLTWRDVDGVAAYGDLVLPPDHRPGDRHPLVIVQYNSRGFLRGGTGDEYPIQAFAGRGFAVLSVQRPMPFAAGRARDFPEFMRMSIAGFAERRRVLTSLEAGVRTVIASGTVDHEKIGITGLSDGAATVQFALVNSDLFRAAAMSSCCDEPSTAMFAADPGYGEMLLAAGFPAPGTPDPGFWSRYSLAANARRIRTPILLQLPEDEYRFGLETFVTLDRQHVPIEMYVFADGYHQKWRPAQRLASYERAIDWFDFWLNGRVDESPAEQAQYARWRALAARQPPAG